DLFARWFTYVTRDSDAAYHRAFTDLVGLQYNHRAALRDARSLAEVRRVLAEGRTWSRQRRRGDRAVIKDPIAVFSAEWLADRFDAHVITVIRHPAAFVS